MPTIPTYHNMSATSADILNAIRNSATTNFQNYVPVAYNDAASIRNIGSIIMLYPALQNEFLSALVNRIGRVLITSKVYQNPWNMFKRGELQFGETIEEVFANIAAPYEFDPESSASTVFAQAKPDVRSTFHVLNYQKFYKVTVSHDMLKTAFLTVNGVNELVTRIINTMFTGENYDEFLTMKYLIANNLINGRMTPVSVPNLTTPTAYTEAAGIIKSVSNSFEFLSSDYNAAKVSNSCLKDSQYLIVSADFDAKMDVNVLAAAFNMSKSEFMGHKVMVDSFGSLDINRLNSLFAGAPTTVYDPSKWGSDVLNALNAIPAVLVSKDWFMVLDNLTRMTEMQNPEGLYWNYWRHVWKTFSSSPYENAAVFVPNVTPDVTAITLGPSGASVKPGQTITLTCDVTTTGYAPKTVTYSIDNTYASHVDMDASGIIYVHSDAPSGTMTVTATSTYKSSVTGDLAITVGNG